VTTTNSQPDSSTTGRHIPALDGVRGLAIVAVLICHLFWSNNDPAGGPLVRFIAQARAAGWVGVDLFFVLSGFLITGILYDTLPDRHFFKNFYARRMLRIFPLYYGFFALLFLITIPAGYHWHLTVFRYLTYTDNILFVFNGPITDVPWININHFWSLMVEEQFYIVWPLMVFLLQSRRRIAIAAAVGILASFLTRLAVVHTGAEIGHFSLLTSWTPARLDSLFSGALLSMIVRSRFRERAITAAVPIMLFSLVVIGVIWIRSSGFVPDVGTPVATWGVLMLSIGFAAFVAASLRHGSVFQRFTSGSILRFFGRYSYGIYVYHYTIADLINGHLRPVVLAHSGSKFLSVLLPGLLGGMISVAVAWLSFTFYEKRFLMLKSRFHDHSRRSKLHDVIPES